MIFKKSVQELCLEAYNAGIADAQKGTSGEYPVTQSNNPVEQMLNEKTWMALHYVAGQLQARAQDPDYAKLCQQKAADIRQKVTRNFSHLNPVQHRDYVKMLQPVQRQLCDKLDEIVNKQ